jgi:nuclear GTP-binding protein
MRRIYLIDCPGIVPTSAHDSETDTVLKGVVRVENLSTPSEFIPTLLHRVRPVYITRTYDLPSNPHADSDPRGVDTPWNADEFLEVLARKSGKLLKGGEPDRETVSKMVLNDWIRGKIPFFVRPPERDGEAIVAREEEGKPTSGKSKEKTILGVQQQVDKIPLNAKFLADDRSPGASEGELDDAAENMEDEPAEEDPERNGDVDNDGEGDEEALGWDDIYGAVTAATNGKTGRSYFVSDMAIQTDSRLVKVQDAVPDPVSAAVEAIPSDDATEVIKLKTPRMKTNKVRSSFSFCFFSSHRILGM